MYTGNITKLFKIKNFLIDEGFDIVNAIHIGKDNYEFYNVSPINKGGITNTKNIIARLENEKYFIKQ